jgi:hypothetical protein
MLKRFSLMFPVLLLAALLQLSAQILPGAGQQDELLSFVGLKLDDLVMRFGIPQSVHAARGGEHWQDDVVFVYNEGDFYIFRDRVWQIGLRTAYGIRIGDAKAVALLTFGDRAQDHGDYILYPLPGGNWPLSLRVNISDGRISGIFVYRQDF